MSNTFDEIRNATADDIGIIAVTNAYIYGKQTTSNFFQSYLSRRGYDPSTWQVQKHNGTVSLEYPIKMAHYDFETKIMHDDEKAPAPKFLIVNGHQGNKTLSNGSGSIKLLASDLVKLLVETFGDETPTCYMFYACNAGASGFCEDFVQILSQTLDNKVVSALCSSEEVCRWSQNERESKFLNKQYAIKVFSSHPESTEGEYKALLMSEILQKKLKCRKRKSVQVFKTPKTSFRDGVFLSAKSSFSD